MQRKTRLATASILLALFIVGIPALTPRAHAAAAPCGVTTLKCGIIILSPGTGGTLNNNQTVQKSFLVSFLAQNFTLVEPTLTTAVNTTTSGPTAHNEGHVHVFVDGAYTTIWTSSNGIPMSLSPGTHTIRLDLVNDFHQEFNPAISASTTVKVVDPLASITSTINGIQSAQSNASNAQIYSLAALVVSIIVLILVAYVAFKPKPKTP